MAEIRTWLQFVDVEGPGPASSEITAYAWPILDYISFWNAGDLQLSVPLWNSSSLT